MKESTLIATSVHTMIRSHLRHQWVVWERLLGELDVCHSHNMVRLKPTQDLLPVTSLVGKPTTPRCGRSLCVPCTAPTPSACSLCMLLAMQRPKRAATARSSKQATYTIDEGSEDDFQEDDSEEEEIQKPPAKVQKTGRASSVTTADRAKKPAAARAAKGKAAAKAVEEEDEDAMLLQDSDDENDESVANGVFLLFNPVCRALLMCSLLFVP